MPRVQPGVDLARVSDVARSIQVHGERYLQRVHTRAELEQTATMDPDRRAEHLTGRFAAKEAVVKALRVPHELGFGWRDVEVISREGLPHVVLHGALEQWAARQGVSAVEVSISHDDGQAIAFALATVEVPADDLSEGHHGTAQHGTAQPAPASPGADTTNTDLKEHDE